MISLAWLIVFLVVAIGFVAVGAVCVWQVKDGDNLGAAGIVLVIGGVCLILLIDAAVYAKGTGTVADASRLRLDQTYSVRGSIDYDESTTLVILKDYQGYIFAITIPAEDKSVAKGQLAKLEMVEARQTLVSADPPLRASGQ